MNVRMFFKMAVGVIVFYSLSMRMIVFMGPASHSTVNTPDEVQESEQKQKPSGEISTKRLNEFKLEYGYSQNQSG